MRCRIIGVFNRSFFVLELGHFFYQKYTKPVQRDTWIRVSESLTFEVTACLCCLGAGSKNLNREKGKEVLQLAAKRKQVHKLTE